MRKVSFFRSIHIKFVLIYVLLILIAMQIIGVYFVGKLEDQLVENFQSGIKGRIPLLEYNLKEEMNKDRTGEDVPPLEEEIRNILYDFTANDISEVQVINNRNVIIGTSESDNQGVVGQKIQNMMVKRTISFGEDLDKIQFDKKSEGRIWVVTSPITANGEVVGAILLVAKIETVFEQLSEINSIFITGTVIAMLITALLGIVLARMITKPIADMKKQATAMAKGNFSRKVRVYGDDEIGQLAKSFNHLTKGLQEAQATTEGERRKLSSVLSFMTDGVIATDRKGRVIIINERAAEMLNVSRETVLSQPIVELLELKEDYNFDDLLAEQESIVLDYSTRESHFILRANMSVIQRETGFVNGLIVVLHDVTEQEKLDRERREFVSNVSHELRTPLTTMRSYLEALSDGAIKDDELGPRFLGVTRNETERMIRLVNDLLDLSKMDSRNFTINPDWINFTSFLNQIIDRFEMSKERHVHFKRLLPKEAVFVEIDEDKLTQVIDNIISNALKYSPEGGTITFRVKLLDDHIEVSISDQGIGIPKDNLTKVFERFYRVDRARTRQLGGTGLGLAIAKEIIGVHGGDIWAKSQEGKGTTIIFTLPYDPVQEDDWL
ncbi:two-component system sensor histidine kinase VicK [Lederbergia galactosidilyticus]|uniref:cell wall metabolism sensor histidine kinase WalK n=1 Tax=Lederbergia galactosidilytica TaxID=217031 RepID=UPI001AE39C8C|nr:cell wall metabolism sensor histidine kinase WalK [Lederbergia galactosidilytica]MBP1915197.1 two-component system sensor histidine kinase VicK [Lederbergia galactosidilytica]